MSSARFCSRRHFLHSNGFGLGTLALASLLEKDGLLAARFPSKTEPDDAELIAAIEKALSAK